MTMWHRIRNLTFFRPAYTLMATGQALEWTIEIEDVGLRLREGQMGSQ